MHQTELGCVSRTFDVAAPIGGATKRTFDFTFALLAIILLAPLFAAVIVLIRLYDGGPAIYRHPRIGRNGRTFDCLKFRTMVLDADKVLMQHLAINEAAAAEWTATRKLKDDPRITPLGRVLRRTSVDELPQLINIVKGEMSLVGPRPIVFDEVVHYGPYITDYCRARPGLTGLWQVSGRNDIVYHERVKLDCHYVAHWSVRLDFVIIVRTVPTVLSAHGCY